jgi:hypothetical protein
MSERKKQARPKRVQLTKQAQSKQVLCVPEDSMAVLDSLPVKRPPRRQPVLRLLYAISPGDLRNRRSMRSSTEHRSFLLRN